MIYEYAVDPQLVAQWAKNSEVGLAPQFGLDQRRIVSDFPRDWKGLVAGKLLEFFGWEAVGEPDYIEASNFLNVLLEFMEPSAIHRRQVDTGQPWLEQAIQENNVDPFYALLGNAPVAGNEFVITPDVVNDVRNARWHLPTVHVTRKTASALAEQLDTLLRTATQIILVDPYFKADDEDYRKVLSELLHRAVLNRPRARPRPTVTVMSGTKDRDPVGSYPKEEQLLRESVHRCGHAQRKLGPCVPKGMSIQFQCIAEFASGDQAHNRFLLTDVGGASIPYGTQALGDNVFDDLTPLFAGQYRTRWRQYGKGDGLNIIGAPVIIHGERD